MAGRNQNIHAYGFTEYNCKAAERNMSLFSGKHFCAKPIMIYIDHKFANKIQYYA